MLCIVSVLSYLCTKSSTRLSSYNDDIEILIFWFKIFMQEKWMSVELLYSAGCNTWSLQKENITQNHKNVQYGTDVSELNYYG